MDDDTKAVKAVIGAIDGLPRGLAHNLRGKLKVALQALGCRESVFQLRAWVGSTALRTNPELTFAEQLEIYAENEVAQEAFWIAQEQLCAMEEMVALHPMPASEDLTCHWFYLKPELVVVLVLRKYSLADYAELICGGDQRPVRATAKVGEGG